ncbi:hypothetical protein ANN_07479 [Periplaneta americana]|uniref:Uncharacterized protein n=1 Tax=Periplaneta americana TaxID=6978 RepID=A0ABQ8T0C9_PERAM|nr:hypothetical protein ANN_07479 [Periplaneta americana]
MQRKKSERRRRKKAEKEVGEKAEEGEKTEKRGDGGGKRRKVGEKAKVIVEKSVEGEEKSERRRRKKQRRLNEEKSKFLHFHKNWSQVAVSCDKGKILRKQLRFHPYRLQLLQALQPDDKVLRRNFCISMQTVIENDDECIHFVMFSDEATFHLSGKVNRHNLTIWRSETLVLTWNLTIGLMYAVLPRGDTLNIFKLLYVDDEMSVNWSVFVKFQSVSQRTEQASLVYRSSTRVCVRNCISIRRPEFECSGPQLEGPEFEYSGLSLKPTEFCTPQDAPFSIESFLCHCYTNVTAYSTPQTFEAVHTLAVLPHLEFARLPSLSFFR